MRAAVGIKAAEQAVAADRLGKPAKARHRALFFDQKGRVDGARRVIRGDDQVEIAVERADPAVAGAVLGQQHARQRPSLPPFAVGAAAPLLRGRQYGPLQRQPGHRVAELVVVMLLHLLVEMLHREVPVALLIEGLHRAQLRRRRPSRRHLAQPPIAQPLGAVLLIAQQQPPEMPARHPQNLAGLLRRQPTLAVPLHRFFELQHEDLP